MSNLLEKVQRFNFFQVLGMYLVLLVIIAVLPDPLELLRDLLAPFAVLTLLWLYWLVLSWLWAEINRDFDEIEGMSPALVASVHTNSPHFDAAIQEQSNDELKIEDLK